MKRRRLGTSDLEISSIGLGTYAIGGTGWKFAWGPQDDADSLAALHRGLDAGINWIDTAPAYGLGHAEEIVGQVLKERKDKPLVFTKCALVWEQGSSQLSPLLSAESVRREVEASLSRLGVDVIDLYQVHWPRDEQHLAEGWETMAQLRDEGKVRYIGGSNFTVAHMEQLGSIAPLTSLQPPYSMLSRDAEAAILPFAESHRIGVIAYAPMQSGLLSGHMTRARVQALPDNDWRRDSAQFKDPLLSRNLAVGELLAQIAKDSGFTVPEIAIAWVLRHSAVTGAIVGARRAKHVEDFLRVDKVQFDQATLARIDAACAG